MTVRTVVGFVVLASSSMFGIAWLETDLSRALPVALGFAVVLSVMGVGVLLMFGEDEP